MKKKLIDELQEYVCLTDFGCMNTVYADILQQEATTIDICLDQAIIYAKCGNTDKVKKLLDKAKELAKKN